MQNSNSSDGPKDQQCNEVDVRHHNANPLVSGWVNCPIEPNIGDRIIVWRDYHTCYAEGIYEGNQTILTSPNCHFGSYDKWLLVEPCR